MSSAQDPQRLNDYKATLNLAQTDFPLRPSAAQDDPELLARWEKEGVCKAAQMNHADGVSYILHDGPPYANGDIHVGHAYNKILKDIIAKSQRMSGKHVRVIPGWDCHGLPIEHKVLQEQQIDASNPVAVKRACRSYARGWIDKQMASFERLGVFMDWRHPYITMDPQYEAATIRALQSLVEKGFITRKYKTVAWCFHCQTTLASAEIEYQERRDPSLYVAFRIDPSTVADALLHEASFLVWTTTPWTLPLNRAVALNPHARYALVRMGERMLVMGAERVAALAAVFEQPYEILAELPAAAFAGVRVMHPCDTTMTVPILFGDHVGTTEGTAAVHTAPGCGPEDYELGVKQGLEIYAPITPDGRYRDDIVPRELAGMLVSEAHGTIITMLQQAGTLVHKGSLRHSYPHCWRCRHGLIYRATQQWFFELHHDELQARAVAASESIIFSPRQGSSFLRAAIENRWEWCLSRQRIWGVPIPALVCTSCDDALLDASIIARVAERVATEGIEYWDTVAVEDIAQGRTCTHCHASSWRKERDILDVWFDSGVSHAVVLTDAWGQSYPADLYLEGIDQYRGWFQSSLLTGLALHRDAPMKLIMSHGFTVDDKGRKMSKSLGNVVQPQQLIDRLGTDGVRLWVASVDHGSDVVVSESLLKNVEQVYLKIRNSCRFMLQNVGTYDPSHLLPFDQLLYIDRCMLVEWIRFHETMRAAYSSYDTTGVFHGMGDACTSMLSAIYFDVIKDRLYTELPEGRERRSAQTVLWYILDSITRCMAPILSFTMERVADHYRHQWSESVHLQTFVTQDAFNVPVSALRHDAEYYFVWNYVLKLRDGVMRTLERERESGLFKHSRQAAVVISYDSMSPEGAALARVCEYIRAAGESPEAVLAELYVVATVAVQPVVQEHAREIMPGVYCAVQHADGARCQRCWRWRHLNDGSGLCARCAEVVALLQ